MRQGCVVMDNKPNVQLKNHAENTFGKHLSPITSQLSGILKSNNKIEEIEEAHHVWLMLKESLHEFEEDFKIER